MEADCSNVGTEFVIPNWILSRRCRTIGYKEALSPVLIIFVFLSLALIQRQNLQRTQTNLDKMKSFFVATAALFSVVSALPAMPWEVMMTPPPAGTQFYTLQSKSYVLSTSFWLSAR